MKEFLQNKWFKFGYWALLYLLWVIWLGNYWWLFGLAIIFDLRITQKVKWAFWKKNYKEGEKHNFWLDWLDAIIFSVVVVGFINIFFVQAYMIPSSSMEKTLMTGDYLFVGKLAYGPKPPQRPLSLPLVHNTFLGGKSYSDLIKLDQTRLRGFSKVERDDIVVFSFPHGDTVLASVPMDDYYKYLRSTDREYTQRTYGPIIVRPTDKKDNYVKRCVAIAGDSLEIIAGNIIVNGQQQENYPGIQNTYTVLTNGTSINPKLLKDLDISPDESWFDPRIPGYRYMPLNEDLVEDILSIRNVISVDRNVDIYNPDYPDSSLMIFPFSENYKWTKDNFGPIYIPAKGDVIDLNLENLPLYSRLITAYEGNNLEVKGADIYINGNKVSTYTFLQDYYFMMGDNRHNSLDSRYWGFVPEDHVVGKPRIIWFSSDKSKSFPRNIRWDRLFKFV